MKTIFEMESDSLERPLDWCDRIRVISKYTAITGFLVLIPVWLVDYWQVSHIYDKQRIFLFENIEFQVKRAPQGSEARIVLYDKGVQKFTSSCSGLEGRVCGKKEFYSRSAAKLVQFIETHPNKGIIQKIVTSNASGNREFTNFEVDDYIENFSENTYRNDWRMLFLCMIACVFYFLSKVIHCKNRKGR